MRELLGHVGGTLSSEGSTEEAEQLIPRLNDRQLRQSCDALHKAWLRVWAHRPLAHLGPNGAWWGAGIVVQEDVGAARQAICAVVKRANVLERHLSRG